MNRSIPFALVALALVAGCSAETADVESDDEFGAEESALTQDQKDDRRITSIRRAVANVEESKVSMSKRVKAPARSPSSGARTDQASLYGVDWFQKWPGGVNADHSWDNGTEYGKRCMWAAVARFEAIMKDPPEELASFRGEYSKWGGSFYNWVADYSKPEAFGDASEAKLWAWRTGLSKWISAAGKDGTCYLPTKKMVSDYLKACKEHIASNDGEMEGCRN